MKKLLLLKLFILIFALSGQKVVLGQKSFNFLEDSTSNKGYYAQSAAKKSDYIEPTKRIEPIENAERRFKRDSWKDRINLVYDQTNEHLNTGKTMAEIYHPFFQDVHKVLSKEYGAAQADIKLQLYLDLKNEMKVSRGEIDGEDDMIDEFNTDLGDDALPESEVSDIFPQESIINSLKDEIEIKFELQKNVIFGEALAEINQLIDHHNHNLLEAYGTTQTEFSRTEAYKTYNRNGQEITEIRETTVYDTHPKLKIQF